MCTARLCPRNQLYQDSTSEQGLSAKLAKPQCPLWAFHCETIKIHTGINILLLQISPTIGRRDMKFCYAHTFSYNHGQKC